MCLGRQIVKNDKFTPKKENELHMGFNNFKDFGQI